MLRPRYILPPIETVEDLVLMLGIQGLTSVELMEIGSRSANLYRTWPKRKKSGQGYRRISEAEPPLKGIQCAIHERILSTPAIAYPFYIRAYVKGRNIRQNAEIHLDATTEITLDITDFYDSIERELVLDVFSTLCGFPEPVAELLGDLTCLHGHPPQGAATSPALANLVLFKSEPTLVQGFRKKQLKYTRFGDDIVVSTRYRLTQSEVAWINTQVGEMLATYGLIVNRDKAKVVYRGEQRMEVTGLTIDAGRPSKSDAERKRVRAHVHQILQQVKADESVRSTVEYRKDWQRVMGRVREVLIYNDKAEFKKYLVELKKVAPLG